MSSSAEECAAALAEYLDTQDFSFAFRVTAPSEVELRLEDANVTVQVYSHSEEEVITGRRCVQQTYEINVVIAAPLTMAKDRRAFMGLIKEVKESIRYQKIDGCNWQGTEITVLWDDTINRENDQVTALLRPSYSEMSQ